MTSSMRLTAALLAAIVRLSPAADGGSGPEPKATKSGAVSFKEAIDWHLQRTPVTAEEYATIEADAKRRAFTIANVAQLDTVVRVHEAINKAIENGTTLEEFKKEIGPALEAEWKGTVDNPAWRMEVIFRNAVQTAYNTGRYQQATTETALKTRPYWRFDGVKDSRQSPICKACNGVVRPANDAWWRAHIPPLHHACRSKFTTLTARQAEQIGIKSDEDLKKTQPAQAGFGLAPDATAEEIENAKKAAEAQKKPAPAKGTEPTKATEKPTEAAKTPTVAQQESQAAAEAIRKREEVAPVEAAIAQKKQAVHEAQGAAAELPQSAPSNPPPTPPAAPPGGGGGGDGGDGREFEPVGTKLHEVLTFKGKIDPAVLDGIGAIESVHGLGDVDPAEVEKFTVRMTKAKARLGEFHDDIQEIGIAKDDKEKRLTTGHEGGHLLDKRYLSRLAGYASGNESAEAVQKVMAVIKSSADYRRLEELASKSSEIVTVNGKTQHIAIRQAIVNYLKRDREVFARAYSQYIAVRSQNKALLDELANCLERTGKAYVYYPEQWKAEEFEPIAAAFDQLFLDLGWMRRIN